jgi:acyl carrier protein
MTYTREQILADVLELLNSVVQDWEFEGAVGPGTRLFADLAFESLDFVILGTKVQERFGRTLPFAQLFAEMGQREVKDLTIGEWVDFISRHVSEPVHVPAAVAVRSEGT